MHLFLTPLNTKIRNSHLIMFDFLMLSLCPGKFKKDQNNSFKFFFCIYIDLFIFI